MSAIGDPAPGGPQTVSAQGGPSAPTPPPGAPARQSAFRRLLQTSPAYMSGVLLVLILIFSAIDPAFHSTSNFRNILTDASILLVMAVGMTYVMVAAGFDLSIGSVLVFSGVVGIKAMVALGTDNALTVLVGLVVSCLGGLSWGIFNGLCITKLRVPALITTLGSLGAALGIARLITHGNDVRGVPLTLIKITTGGHSVGGNGFYFEPTVVAGAKQDDEIVRKEVFGPVVSVTRFSDPEDAIAWAPDSDFAANYFGGQPEEYDVIKVDPGRGYNIFATDGTMDAWTRLWQAAVNGFASDAAYQKVQGNNPDGTRNPIDAPLRIHSVGNVVIEDDVEIGAATTIDRATLRETRIGRGSKIDNQVQIAHNVTVGEAVLICGMVGLAGTTVVTDGLWSVTNKGGEQLLVTVHEDARTVLAAHVAELAVGHGRVDVVPESVEQLLVRHLLRIVEHLHRLGVARGAARDFLVGRIGFRSADVA